EVIADEWSFAISRGCTARHWRTHSCSRSVYACLKTRDSCSQDALPSKRVERVANVPSSYGSGYPACTERSRSRPIRRTPRQELCGLRLLLRSENQRPLVAH